MKAKSTKMRKQEMLNALAEHKGIVTIAVKDVGINRKTYYEWLKTDPKFKEKADNIPNQVGDFVESKLLELVNDLHPAAIIFYCKTKLKGRGYIERHELNTKQEQTIKVVDARD